MVSGAQSSSASSMTTPRPSHVGAGGRERLEQALADALAGHLDQAELGDVEHLGAGLVPGQGVAEDA